MELNEDAKKLITETYKTKCGEVGSKKHPFIKCLGREELDACLECLYAAGYVWGGDGQQLFVPTPREKIDGKDVILIELCESLTSAEKRLKDDLGIYYSEFYSLHEYEPMIDWSDLLKLTVEED